MTTINDDLAARLCDLAAAHLRRDRTGKAAAIKALQLRGWDAPVEAAERVALAAIVEEQKARPPEDEL